MSAYTTRYHRDGTVTVWDVYQQQWTRSAAAAVQADSRVMASLTDRERERITAMASGRTVTEHRKLAAPQRVRHSG